MLKKTAARAAVEAEKTKKAKAASVKKKSEK